MREQVDLDELNRLLWSGCPFDSDFDVMASEEGWGSGAGHFSLQHRYEEFERTCVPTKVRVRAWELALGYVPPRKERQNSAVERKRREYRVI